MIIFIQFPESIRKFMDKLHCNNNKNNSNKKTIITETDNGLRNKMFQYYDSVYIHLNHIHIYINNNNNI